MLKKTVKILLPIILLFTQLYFLFAEPGTPLPEFESDYVHPPTSQSPPRSDFFEIFDVFILVISLSVVTWFVIKKRSRTGVFWTSIFSILYFGFFREGCVCSIGAIQNITLALFNPGYKIPITVIAFFVLPLIYTLFFGRTFCAGVCPLGAIQDIFAFKHFELKSSLQKLLGVIPFIYLGFAVLYAATSTDFIICRYDPFIGFFRLDANFLMFVIGAIFLLTSIFIARPYCRFFCPYGAILNLLSRVSKHHLTITPTKCIQCRLCENSCPFGAINKPEELKLKESKQKTIKRFIFFAILIPLMIFVGAFSGTRFHENLAVVNPKVKLANELIALEKDTIQNNDMIEESVEITSFKTSGKPVKELYAEAASILDIFYKGGGILGGFIGLIFGLTLAGLSIFRYRKNYTPNKGTCLSCARCIDYCPVEKVE